MSRGGIGHLISMGHALNWTPGSWGKGITTPEGDVHTWNIDMVGGAPHHMTYVVDQLGKTTEGMFGVKPSEYPSFSIDPEGQLVGGAFSANAPPNDIEKIDPRLISPKKAWDFQASANHLNWSPGNRGKGITTPEGGVHTWNINPVTDDPIHADYIENVLGIPEGYAYKDYAPFEIDPEGQVYEGPDDIDQVDSRLVPTNKWRFQAAGEGPVQVVNVNHPVKDEPHAPAYCEGPLDKPFAYNPAERIVYLGQPGGYHDDMVGYVPHDNVLGLPQGRLRTPHTETNPYTDEVEHTPIEADWFSKPPENHEEIHQALGAAPLSGKWTWFFQHGAHVAENGQKWQLIKTGHDKRCWQPIEWPFAASVIDDMRDGWGRFAVTAPWEPGQWGKGIYYPETGVLQTWADDRTHLDVWGDDENYSQPGSAHHIVIRPNGTVHDQGAFDRNFGDAQSDVVGLQQALHELDPTLHLDSSATWSFGPTEPMEEEPSSISRGEQGGSVHDVQTANDFAGSL